MSVVSVAVKALVPFPLAMPVSVPTPMPPRETPRVPVQPRVRFCVAIEQVTLVSCVQPCTTFPFNLPAASVPVQVNVCVEPVEEIPTFVSLKNVCDAELKPLSESIPPPPPPPPAPPMVSVYL